jgi:hypothetical protein
MRCWTGQRSVWIDILAQRQDRDSPTAIEAHGWHLTLTIHLAGIRRSLVRIAEKASAARPALASLPFFSHYLHPHDMEDTS